MNLNRVFLGGRLTRDPETKTFDNGSVTTFSLAVNKKFRTKSGEDRETVYFAECKAWGATGENFAKYHKKSDTAFVEGELVTEEWEAKEGGKRSKTVVQVQRWEFVGGGRSEGGATGGGKADPPKPAGRVADRGRLPDPNDRVTEDDIPF